MPRFMSVGFKQARQSWRKQSIDQKTHGLARDQNRVIGFDSSVFQTCTDVSCFEIRIILRNLSLTGSGS